MQGGGASGNEGIGNKCFPFTLKVRTPLLDRFASLVKIPRSVRLDRCH